MAKTNFGEYVAIQAKCYQPGTQVDKADIDTFLSASGKQIAPDGKATYYSARIIIATNDNWTSHASEAIVDQQIPVTRIGLAQIQNSAIDWEKFFAGAKKTIVKKSVRPHQEAAIKDVIKGFEKRDRGQLIMACGTGKTFTSLKIAESICPENGHVLFLVPSISLLGQSLREWCEQAEKPLTPFAVCSDSKVTKDPDDTSLADLGFPATTFAAQLVTYGRKLKKNPPAGLTVVFSTYQSISAVQEAQSAGAFGAFDLIICDEAHRTTGAIFKDKDESEFVRIHDKNFIKGKKRLYMTATPRIYGENAKKKADDEFIELCSMDDESKYGLEFHHLTFSAAVKDDLLTDYKVLILAVDEKDMRDLSLADRDGDGEIDSVDQLAKIVGTWKGLNKRIYKDDAQFLGGDIRPMRSAVAFTSTIAESKAYTGQFDALFADYQFIRNNPISKSLETLLARLNENIDGKDRETLEKFYESVRHKASDKTTAAQKQSIVVQLYNNFFNIAFKDTVEKLGIVYTPVPVVDFIVKSVECVLKKHFNCSISDRGVHVLDPFTGTGTFITRLLQSGFIKPKDLLYKYENEIHANELVLLAYYIAAINIESVFHDVYGECCQCGNVANTNANDQLGIGNIGTGNTGNTGNIYHPFDGIVLTDTFQLGEEGAALPGIFPENSKRAAKQKKLDIRVILGNPPYNVAKGVSYPHLEQRIAETYAKGSGAVNKNSLYDSYIKAFRWASDRIKDEGVVAFVTNGGWLDAQAMNGFRNALVEEFSHIYVFNLRGNQRTQGETSRREGGKIFGQGSRTPVAITILVKGGRAVASRPPEAGAAALVAAETEGPTMSAVIHYHDIGDYLSREEKLRIIDDFGDVTAVPWQAIAPDKHGDWLNKRDSEFDDYIPLAPEEKFDYLAKSWFTINSRGLETARDAWVYNYSATTVRDKMRGFVHEPTHTHARSLRKSDNAFDTPSSETRLLGLSKSAFTLAPSSVR